MKIIQQCIPTLPVPQLPNIYAKHVLKINKHQKIPWKSLHSNQTPFYANIIFYLLAKEYSWIHLDVAWCDFDYQPNLIDFLCAEFVILLCTMFIILCDVFQQPMLQGFCNIFHLVIFHKKVKKMMVIPTSWIIYDGALQVQSTYIYSESLQSRFRLEQIFMIVGKDGF